MNRNFYFFAIFFMTLSALSGVTQTILYFLLGAQVYTLESFMIWYLVGNIVSFAGSLFTLKYYHHKKYKFALWAGAVSAFTGLLFGLVVCMMLSRVSQFQMLYIPAFVLAMTAGVVYGISLISSVPNGKSWLKIAGITVFFLCLTLLSALMWSVRAPEIQANGTLEKINQWASLLSSLIPVLFILNFLKELKNEKAENANAVAPKLSGEALIFISTLAFVATLTFGIMVSSEGHSSLYWKKKNFERTEALAALGETGTYVNSKGEKLLYVLVKPLNYDPQRMYPMVVNLPYGAPPGEQGLQQTDGAALAQVLSSETNREKYPAFLFIPYCPSGKGWGGIPNYPTVDTLVFEAINIVKEKFSVDENRIYVTGISRGGYGSWHFICTNPQMFAAAIPVCGGGDPRFAKDIVEVSVWAFHGEKDVNVPVEGSRNMIEAIKKAGGNPRYTEFPNEGHNIWDKVMNTPGLLDWLFEQKRD